MMDQYDVVIVGSGPAGMGAAFGLKKRRPELSILMIDQEPYSTGGMRNDCKMNFTYPIGFPTEYWDAEEANKYLDEVISFLHPHFLDKLNVEVYQNRAQKLDCSLLSIRQTHLGTDGGLLLIKELQKKLREEGVALSLGEKMVDGEMSWISCEEDVMHQIGVPFIDNIVDIGMRIETRIEHYPIVKDYYDPKFYFPEKVRTFCTNSGNAHVVQERYVTSSGEKWFSVNGHAFSAHTETNNGLVNFAILKTVRLTEPLASGQLFAEHLGLQAALLGGGKPIMQRVGDFRMGSRSKAETFNQDLYDFKPTLNATPGDISLAMPSKILRYIWKAMKNLDTIVPGVLHPSTIMYYPEIKFYANKPQNIDDNFRVKEHIWFAGDGAGTSRGITGAWASGLRAADGIVRAL